MPTTARFTLCLVLATCMASACMETAPVPDWVHACQDAQGCAPEDANSTPDSE